MARTLLVVLAVACFLAGCRNRAPVDAGGSPATPTLAEARDALIQCIKSGELERSLAGPDGEYRKFWAREVETLESPRSLDALKNAEVSSTFKDAVLVDIWWIDLANRKFSATWSHSRLCMYTICGHFQCDASGEWVAAVDNWSHADLDPNERKNRDDGPVL
jgi:hypothetical protein